jgi:hypothetical protein
MHYVVVFNSMLVFKGPNLALQVAVIKSHTSGIGVKFEFVSLGIQLSNKQQSMEGGPPPPHNDNCPYEG